MMRILIVDDNVALQEVLTEIIANADHTVEIAASVDDAISLIGASLPDIVLLDADTDNGNGLTLIDMIQENHPNIGSRILILRSWNQQIPQDNSLVRGVVEKPFTTSDILNGILSASLDDDTVEEARIQTDAEEETESQPKRTLSSKNIHFGESYVMFRGNNKEIFDLVSQFDIEGYDVLLVTATKKKTISERFKSNKIEMMPMTVKLMGGHLNIYRLGTMIDEVTKFIERKERPVVAFEDLNPLIERNGMNSVLTSVHQIVNRKYDRKTTFLVSVDPVGFTKKDKEILLNHMNNYDPTGE